MFHRKLRTGYGRHRRTIFTLFTAVGDRPSYFSTVFTVIAARLTMSKTGRRLNADTLNCSMQGLLHNVKCEPLLEPGRQAGPQLATAGHFRSARGSDPKPGG